MFKIYSGRAKTGKTTKLFEDIKIGTQERRNQILVVPEMLSHEMERRLLKKCGNPVARFAEVLTFKRLAARILREDGQAVNLLDSGGRVLAMYRALREVETALKYYNTALSRPDMIERLVSLIDELKSCRVLPEELMRVSGETEEIADKIYDIALIYSAYCSVTSKIGLDDKDLLTVAAEKMKKSDFASGYDIYFDGFMGFTAQEYEMCSVLLSRCNNMEFAITSQRNETIFHEQEQLISHLIDMAERQRTDFKEEILEREYKNTAFDFIEKELFGYENVSFDGECDNIEVISAQSAREECAVAASIIRKEIANGKRYRDIAITAGNFDSYSGLLEIEFEKFDVPIFLAEKSDILAKPVMRALVGAIDAVSSGMTQDAVFTYIKSGLSPITNEESDLLENYVLTWNIRGGQYFAPFTKNPYGFDLSRASDGEGLLPKIEEIRKKLALPLENLKKSLAECDCGEKYGEALRKFLEDTNLKGAIEAKIKALEERDRLREAAEYAQLYDIFEDCLAQFCEAMQGVLMDTNEFLRLWRLMLSQYSVSSIPVTLDAVQAGGFDRLSFNDVEHLIVLGAVDGMLPPVGKSSGLLSERDRVTLETAGIELTQTAEEHAFEKQSRIYSGFSSPKEKLTIMYPMYESDGTKTRTSYILRRLNAILPNVKTTVPDEQYMLTASKPSFELACMSLANQGGIYGETARQIALCEPKNGEFFNTLRKYSSSSRGPIKSKNLIEAAYGKKVRMTASRAEKIASCRFSYFMQYGIRARARKIAKFGAPEVGTMLHYVVENAIRELSRDKAQSPREVALRFTDDYINEMLDGLKTQSARVIALFKRMRKMVANIVEDVWEELQNSLFEPVSFEMTFGQKGENPAIEMTSGDMTIELVGQIDRVDGYMRGDTLYIKVADYKTGKKKFRLSDILSGINMQMFIYLILLQNGREALRDEAEKVFSIRPLGEKTAGVLYIPAKTPYVNAEYGEDEESIHKKQQKEIHRIGLVIDDKEIIEAMETGGEYKFLPVSIKKDGNFSETSSVAGEKGFEQLIKKTDKILRKIATDISNGDIEAEPIMKTPEESVCRFCEFRDACHFDETMEKDKAKKIKNLSDREVFAILSEEDSQNGR